MTKTKNIWIRLISTLWFLPALFVVTGILSGILLTGFDYFFGSPFRYLPYLFGVQPSGARDILAVIAGSAITVAGTVFSITIVALTLASTQFSPRVLRNFMRDTGNQSVLGTLVGIFAYCIVVLRTIRDGSHTGETDFVPSTAIFFGVILALIGIGCLIYFIHHVATSIQATQIISLIAQETVREIRDSFPTDAPENEIDGQTKDFLNKTPCLSVKAGKTGYVQNADKASLIRLADQNDLILKMQRRIGQFTIEGLPILQVFPADPDFELDEELSERFRETYDVSSFRTVGGDVAFGLRQIVDIALKALSPAINDATTAVTCVDYLTAIMVCLAKRPSCTCNYFAGGKLRLIVEEQRFEDFFDLAFNQIRQNAGANVAVILRQLNGVNILSLINVGLPFEEERRERHELMQTQARLLFELAEQTVKADADLETVSRYYQRIEKSLTERESKI
ncbi:MAG: DUF2254 domain-containing protein [Pyrinomonadaceae bacterium]